MPCLPIYHCRAAARVVVSWALYFRRRHYWGGSTTPTSCDCTGPALAPAVSAWLRSCVEEATCTVRCGAGRAA